MRNIFTILLFLSLTLTVSKLHGQIFPVQATTQLSPPYSLYLSDYVASGSERLVLNLFLGDIQRPQLDVRFRLRIVGQNVTIETKPEYMPPPVSLHGGVPLRLMNTDLAHYFHPNNLNFQGITKQQYERMGKLPEGVYQFCFEVLEYNRGVKISNTACAVAWMVLNDPPIINLPRQDEKIRPQLPQNIVFQWTPRHTGSPNSAFTTEYTFEMVEVWPENRNPNDAILTSPKILEATTQTTTFIYGPSEVQLEPGRRYAFRIRAKAQSGIDELDLFKNQGYSEVYTFMYGDACGLPSDVVAQPLSSSRVKFGWDVLAKHSLFNVRYREAGTTDWYINESTLNETIVNSLKPATVYEYQVSGICGSVRGEFSDIATVKTPEAPPSEYTCGLPIQTFDLDPSQLTGSLKVGDIVNAGDFDVSLTKVTGSNGVFTGEGVVVMPMMNKVKVKVDFKSITVATDPTDGANRLVKGDMNVIGGELEIVPQGVLNAIEKLDEILDIADSALTLVETYLPREGPDPSSFAADTLITFDANIVAVVPNNETGKVYVTTSDGKVTELPADGNVAVVDSKGKGYVVDKKGGVTKTTAEEATKASKREYNFAVQFAKSQSSKFGFDAYDGKKVQLAFTYESLNDTYYVPWKAASQTTGDVVEATLSDASLNPEHIRFEMIGLEAAATLVGNDKWNIKIISSTHAAKIIAYYQQPGDEKEQILGKLNVSAFDQKDLNLVIVKDDNVNINLETIGAKLNEIYGQAIANWKVSYESRDLGIDKNFDAGGTSVLTNYTADMRKVISNWGALQEDTYYMFVIDKPTNSGDVNAFMPRSRQAGFIYADGSSVDAYAHTIAHELGHGAFALRHPFLEFGGLQQNTTNNLMDYTGVGNHHLMHFQWERIHDPVTVIGLFDEDEEAEDRSNDGIDLLGNVIVNVSYVSSENTLVGILSREYPYLRTGYNEYRNDEQHTLLNQYIASIKNGMVMYIDQNGNEMPYEVETAESGSPKVFLLNDDCSYSVTTIHGWKRPSDAELINNEVNKRLREQKPEWKKHSLFKKDPSCFILNSLSSLINNDRNRDICSPERISLDSAKLKILFDQSILTNKQIVEVLVDGQVCLSALRQVNWFNLSRAIKQLGNTDEYVWEKREIALLRLMAAINSDNYEKFIDLLEEENNKLLFNLISKIQDRSVNPWDGDNFTSFISGLCAIYNLRPEIWQDRIKPFENNDLLGQILSLEPFEFSIPSQGIWMDMMMMPLGQAKFEGRLDSQNNIEITRWVKYLVSIPTWAKDSGFDAVKLKPLDPIIIQTRNNLPLVQTALDGFTSLGEDLYVVPAIFLDYKTEKEIDDAIEKGIILSLDVITIAASGGTAIATKVHWARRLWAITEVVAAGSNVAITTEIIDPNSNYGKATNAYNLTMGILGLKNSIKGLSNISKNLPLQVKNALQAGQTIKPFLAQQIRSFRNYITELKKPNGGWDDLDDLAKERLTTQDEFLKHLDETIEVAEDVKTTTISSTPPNGSNVPLSLISKLTQEGSVKLKAWSRKTKLSYKGLSGAEAEAKLFDDLASKLANHNVLEVVEDAQGRLLVRTNSKVYGLHDDVNKTHDIFEYVQPYRKTDFPLSANKLAPDFANTPHLYPVGRNQNNIVRIKMTGKRKGVDGDFIEASKKAGLDGLENPVDANGIIYTWHHLDDFDPETGECTMQLVKQSEHRKSTPHTGSVNQYEKYYGIEGKYK